MADNKNEESSSESEIDTNRGQQVAGYKQSAFPKDTMLEGSSSQGLSGGSTGGKSSENLQNTNNMPEDKEIQSSSEDEM